MSQQRRSNYIREWRERAGYTQATLAEAAGTTEATISRLESGAIKYTQAKLETIARALDLAPWQLLIHPSEMEALRTIHQSARSLADSENLRILAEEKRPFFGKDPVDDGP